MRLYQKRYQPLVKLAGTKISKNPQQWGAEVLKALASQHPYVDESDVDIKVNYMDPEEKRAFGVVIVAGRAPTRSTQAHIRSPCLRARGSGRDW
jgi:hypothetical protein